MIKNITRIEHKIGDRLFHLLCDQDSPVAEVKEALSQFMAYVVQIENHVVDQQKQAASIDPVEEPPKE